MANQNQLLNPNKWVDNYADYLFRYAVVRVNDDEIAKDLLQETFLAGIKSANNFKGEASEKTWLISILKRKIVDYYRKINSNKAKAEVKINFYDSDENQGDWIEERIPQEWNESADSSIENEELKNQLEACINALPAKYALVFKMKTIQDFETEEICNELGISASNVWVMIHRARTQLRKCMEDNWFKR